MSFNVSVCLFSFSYIYFHEVISVIICKNVFCMSLQFTSTVINYTILLPGLDRQHAYIDRNTHVFRFELPTQYVVVPAMIDRWHHLVFLSQGNGSLMTPYSPPDPSGVITHTQTESSIRLVR